MRPACRRLRLYDPLDPLRSLRPQLGNGPLTAAFYDFSKLIVKRQLVTAWYGPGHHGNVSLGLHEGANVTVAELGPIAYVGIDWASQEHAVCALGTNGRKAKAFPVPHSRDGLKGLVNKLSQLGAAGRVPVAVERPDDRLVDALLEAGHPVVPVSANAIKAWRESEVVSGAKDDPGDAEVIAEYLRLRSHKLTILAPFSEETRALRAVVRSHDDLGQPTGHRPQPTGSLSGRLLAGR